MARLKSSYVIPNPQEESAASDHNSVTLVTPESKMEAFASPALELQETLQQSWDDRHGHAEVAVRKIPFIWTLSAMTAVCGAFWVGVALLVS
jgi:hypothetical protein